MNVVMSESMRAGLRRAVVEQRRSAGRWALACVGVAVVFEGGAQLLLQGPANVAPHGGDIDQIIASPLRFFAGFAALVGACLIGLYAKLSRDAARLAELEAPGGTARPAAPAEQLRAQLAEAKKQAMRHGVRALALPIAGGLTAGICIAPLLLLQAGDGAALGLLVTGLVVVGFLVATVANLLGLMGRVRECRRLGRQVREHELPRATLAADRAKKRGLSGRA